MIALQFSQADSHSWSVLLRGVETLDRGPIGTAEQRPSKAACVPLLDVLERSHGCNNYHNAMPVANGTKRGLFGSVNIWGPNVLRAKAYADQPCWKTSQERPCANQLDRPADFQWFRASQDAPDHLVVHKNLEPLRRASRKAPATLDHFQFAAKRALAQQSLAE